MRFISTLAALIGLPAALSFAADRVPDETFHLTDAFSQWTRHYYQKPEPEALVEKVRAAADAGLLIPDRVQTHVMFLAQVMRSHPVESARWLEAWKDLPPHPLWIIRHAAWESGTAAGRAWLVKTGQKELSDRPLPPVLTNPSMVLAPQHIDQCWEWFFATGDEVPIRRIISSFDRLPGNPQPGALPDEPGRPKDRAAMTNYLNGYAAMTSSVAYGAEHPRVLEILKKCQGDPEFPAHGRQWLQQAISLAEAERDQHLKK